MLLEVPSALFSRRVFQQPLGALLVEDLPVSYVLASTHVMLELTLLAHILSYVFISVLVLLR